MIGQLLDAALAFCEAEYSVVPAATDGTKAPAGRWQPYQSQRPDMTQVQAWLSNGTYDGFGLVCGAVSGGLEMLEFEGRAVKRKLHAGYGSAVDDHGLGDVWRRVIAGYTEFTPSGGLHILYRVTGTVRGNTKLARSASGDVLIETRGEGGFTIVAPSGGRTHPTGKPWQIAAGGPASIVTITEAERDALHAVATLLDEQPPRQAYAAPATGGVAGGRPGDDFNARATWDEILTPHGWQCGRAFGTGRYGWRRPGKDGPGISATTRGDGGLYVFSSSAAPFDTEVPYSKFGAYALLNHSGDFAAAARQLRREGYGSDQSHGDENLEDLIGGTGTSGSQAGTTSATAGTPDGDGEEKADKKSAATILVEIAQALYEFGVSEDGETYGVPRTGPKVVLLLRGGTTSLRAQLAREYFRRKDRAAPQQALADALLTLDGFAQECRPRRLWQRVAQHGDALWLDLGDATGHAVQITATGWTVADRPPVLFRRTVLTGALPRPVPGGDLAELWQWVNVASDDRPLIAAELADRLWPDHPHVVVGLFGEQGSGKSTAAKVLALVVDPGPVPLRKPPRDAEAWVTAAAGSWVVALDNLSGMPDWLSDSICRASTGEGDVRRKLYTDGQLATFAFRRCVLLTGIDLGALNGDLAERLLSADLTPIGEAERLDEEDLWPQWGQVHPRILGALLDLAASVVSSRPSVRLARKPRMADYARTLAAVDQVLGTDGLARYMGAQARMASEALTGDLFITAIAAKLADTDFAGTAAELLTLVTPADDTWRPPKGWPVTPRGVTQRLHRQAPVMRKAGWLVSDDGGENKQHATRWQISAPTPEVGRNPPSPSSPSPESSPDPDEADTAARKASYASNDSDLPTRTCTQCGEPLAPYLAGFGDMTHPDCDPRWTTP